jgi:sterol desaturase/sphingolipid hydroxylase (fatty acid hydroxylase superfamily)
MQPFWSLTTILVSMGVLALVESILPFKERGAWRRGHLAANLALTAGMLALNLFLTGVLVVGLHAARARGFGLLAGHPLSTAIVMAIGIVALDLATWVAHWSMHRIPAMWRVHSVHHADPMVDVTTSFRMHPLEGMWRFGFILVPAMLLGLPMKVVAVYRLVSAVNGLLEHTNVAVRSSVDRALSIVVVTPNMHKLHHSRNLAESGTNYGNIFALFDRVLGTFTSTDRAATVEYGLDGHDAAEPQRLVELIRMPFRRARTLPSS